MRKLLIAVLFLSPLAAEMCLAQTSPITIVCEECRDPIEYPDDFINFGFNQIYGPEAWLSFDLADDFYIINLDGGRAYLDADYVFLGLGFKGLRLPFWPTNLLQITLALPDGTIYVALRSTFLFPLPVPASSEKKQLDEDDGGSAGDGDSDGEDEEENDLDIDEWEEPEIDGPEGITSIEDPDENGEFPETEWCVEC